MRAFRYVVLYGVVLGYGCRTERPVVDQKEMAIALPEERPVLDSVELMIESKDESSVPSDAVVSKPAPVLSKVIEETERKKTEESAAQVKRKTVSVPPVQKHPIPLKVAPTEKPAVVEESKTESILPEESGEKSLDATVEIEKKSPLDTLLLAIQEKYKNVSSLEGRFTQVTQNPALPAPVTQSGRLYVMKPNRLLWDIQEPLVQSYYSNGETLKVWNELNSQLLVSNQVSGGSEIISILNDLSHLSQRYDVSLGQDTESEYQLLVAPQQDEGFSQLILYFSKVDFQLVRLQTQSEAMGDVELRLQNLRYNTLKDPSIFEFIPPEGAEIITADRVQ